MRGIADGVGLDLTDVLAINVRTEVMYSAKARQAPLTARAPAECSAFAHVPGPGQPGAAIPGQNWDWLLHSARTLVVLEAGRTRVRTSSRWSRPACWPRPG